MINSVPMSTPTDKITVEIPAVKLEIDLSGHTFESLEQMIFDIVRELGRKSLEQIMLKCDEFLRIRRPKKIFENTGYKTKYVQTMLGEIVYKRTRYKEYISGKVRYFLDEALRFESEQQISLKLYKILCVLISCDTYRKVQKQLYDLVGLNYSHEGLRQLVLKEGKRLEEYDKAKLAQEKKRLLHSTAEVKPDLVVAEMDATYVHLQGKVRKKAEIKLAIAYKGKSQRYKGGSGKSKALVEKNVYASIKESRKEFMENFSYILEGKYNMSLAEKQYFGGDGDTWLRRGQEEYFPEAKYVLCWYHLHKCIKGGLCYDKDLRKKIYRSLASLDIDTAEELIKDYMSKETDPIRKEKATSVLTYIISNHQGIINAVKLKQDNSNVSAGGIEGNIDKVIAQRLKGRGMSWSIDGASAILKIRQKSINGEYDNWWYQERNHKIEVKAGFNKSLTAKQACRATEAMSEYCIEASLPCFRGPDQNKPWVGIMREATRRVSLGVN